MLKKLRKKIFANEYLNDFILNNNISQRSKNDFERFIIQYKDSISMEDAIRVRKLLNKI